MSKYGNKPQVIDGQRFASKREAEVYQALVASERAGAIHDLRMQVRFPLVVNGMRICAYVADFTFEDEQGPHVVDAKGYKTAVYRLKKRLMLACHDIEIEEV